MTSCFPSWVAKHLDNVSITAFGGLRDGWMAQGAGHLSRLGCLGLVEIWDGRGDWVVRLWSFLTNKCSHDWLIKLSGVEAANIRVSPSII